MHTTPGISQIGLAWAGRRMVQLSNVEDILGEIALQLAQKVGFGLLTWPGVF